jgi:hypothetical protein
VGVLLAFIEDEYTDEALTVLLYETVRVGVEEDVEDLEVVILDVLVEDCTSEPETRDDRLTDDEDVGVLEGPREREEVALAVLDLDTEDDLDPVGVTEADFDILDEADIVLEATCVRVVEEEALTVFEDGIESDTLGVDVLDFDIEDVLVDVIELVVVFVDVVELDGNRVLARDRVAIDDRVDDLEAVDVKVGTI